MMFGAQRVVSAVAASMMALGTVSVITAPVVSAQESGSVGELSSALGEVGGSIGQLQGTVNQVNPGAAGTLDGGSLSNLGDFVDNLQGGNILELLSVLQGIPGGLQDVATLAEGASSDPVQANAIVGAIQTLLAPVVPCNVNTDAGQVGIRTNRHEIGRRGGANLQLRLQTYRVPDTIIVKYDGKTIYNSGPVSTRGDRYINIPVPAGRSTSVVVIIKAPINGTEWNYTIGCPA